jgi:hypothetical protein
MYMPQQRRSGKVLGLGLDNKDGHVRVTRSENFHLVGGSQETHEAMQEKSIKFDEKLKARGKQLPQLERREFMDIAAECEMNVVEIRKKDA